LGWLESTSGVSEVKNRLIRTQLTQPQLSLVSSRSLNTCYNNLFLTMHVCTVISDSAQHIDDSMLCSLLGVALHMLHI